MIFSEFGCYMNDILTYSDLIIFIPSLIAIVLILAFVPFLQYVLGRLLLKRWPVIGLRLWAMSGLNLKKLPNFCPYECCISYCKNWTCPNYSIIKKGE